ncbi:MAG: alpha-2-macroglobulin family protein, partial [Pirellulales bacterium]
CVAAKDLMVEPLPPRFLREGDVVQFPVKVSNRSTGRLTGRVQLALFDARTGDSRAGLIDGPVEQAFELAAGASASVFFPVTVADGTDVLRYLATGTTTGSARPLSDGEEALLPVLPRKVLVTETIPVTVRGGETRQVSLDKLAASADNPAIESQSLVVQAVSNPAWYAVLALPYLMEQPDESIDTLFHRLYANAYARHLVASDPRIAQVFEQWRGTAALERPREKNTALVKTLLAEPPWVREATDEREARARIALLFDATRVENEIAAAITRLNSLRNPDGGWPWFPGGRSCDSVTLSVVAGFGRLRANGVAIDVSAATAAVPWIDQRLIEEKEWAERRAARAREAGNEALAAEPVLTPLGVFALYARSFFLEDVPLQGRAAEAHAWCVRVGRQSWTELSHNRSQGQLAIALVRNGERKTAGSIIESLRQRAVGGPRGEQTAGRGEANWQGMWWRQRHPAWWSWLAAPIETQSVLIEAFDEVAGDAESVEAMKAWLVQQKRTSRWPGSRATADAVGVLLGRGRDLLGDASQLAVTIGGEQIRPGKAGASKVEAGTGFFETRFVRREITPAMAAVSFSKPAGGGLAFGGVHWQYLDSIENVEAAGREELAITKQLFVKTFTKAGPVLEPVTADRPVAVGDELVVRLVVTSDRAYEFLELADHRPSLTEPVDVLSGWKWADGVGWYQVTRDASTQLFFEQLPEGTHVFEYSLRVAHRGRASSGFATIRSRYAPEFSARSTSLPLATE